METKRDLLEEMARNENGLVTLRRGVIGAAGKAHRHRAKVVDELVSDGLAIWVNSTRTIAKLTTAGHCRLNG